MAREESYDAVNCKMDDGSREDDSVEERKSSADGSQNYDATRKTCIDTDDVESDGGSASRSDGPLRNCKEAVS